MNLERWLVASDVVISVRLRGKHLVFFQCMLFAICHDIGVLKPYIVDSFDS